MTNDPRHVPPDWSAGRCFTEQVPLYAELAELDADPEANADRIAWIEARLDALQRREVELMPPPVPFPPEIVRDLDALRAARVITSAPPDPTSGLVNGPDHEERS
jgi:hypothetical protein